LANFTSANLIIGITPERYQSSVPTNTKIILTFLRDMDISTFSDATIALEVVGTVLRVPCTYSYSARVLTITPTTALNPGTSFKVTIVGDVNPVNDLLSANITGIKDILGNGMVGIFEWQFTTDSLGVPTTPSLITPVKESAIGSQPIFQWTSVTYAGTAAPYYQIQVSLTNTFETIYWPVAGDVVNQSSVVVQPARSFTYNQEYWWRVRAVSTDSLGHPVPGDWSAVSNFLYGDPTSGTVTPDDAPLGLVPPLAEQVAVLLANPAPATSNLGTYPETISVTLSGAISLSQLNSSTLTLLGEAVDGSWDPEAFKPIFSPSLNGSMFGSGGITVPGPEDSYQQILVSGPLIDSVPQGQSINDQTTITLEVPASYFQSNNRYTVTLTLQELAAPLEWSFTSRWSPVFAGARDVREMTDFFFPQLTDDDIWFKIRRNSLYAIMIQVYPPTQVDGQSWIYRPPMSFNPNNPPFFAREYVRLKSCLDLLREKFMVLLTGPRTSLGDFTVDQQSVALRNNLDLAIKELKEQLRPFEDKLHGHTNRGYARGGHSGRGDMGGRNPLREWPFGIVRKGPNFNS
jgi:hypothetical protein